MPIDRRRCIGLLAAAAAAPVRALEPPRTVALLFDSLISPFWAAALERMRRYALIRGWSILEAVSNMDDHHQFDQVESMIQRGVDGIIIVHTDAKAVIPAIRAANVARIPMVHFNRAPAPSDTYSVAVVADNRKLMDQTVSSLLEVAAARSSRYQAAVLLGDLGDANGANRRDGFDDAVDRCRHRVEVVARIATEWNADKAFAGLTNALRAHPDIDLLVTSSDFLTPQIEQALRIADKWFPAGDPRHVLIAGFDGDENGYQELVNGYYDVDGVQDLDYEVELTFRALQRMWFGERPPKVLMDPGFVITRDTLTQKRDRMWGYEAWAVKHAPIAVTNKTPGRALSSFNVPTTVSQSISDLSVRSVWAVRWAAALGTLVALAHALISPRTLGDTLLAMLPLAILTAGQLLVLLIGQIDLSVTAVLALSSVLSASLMTGHHGVAAAALGVGASLVVGVGIGVLNGLCTAVLRVPSFIVTLAVMMGGCGAAVWYASNVSDTISIADLPSSFLRIGYGTLAGIPVALMLCLVALGFMQYVLSRTVAGRWFYAIGRNAVAARVCGIPVTTVTVSAFVVSGFCASLAAVIYTSRLETGLPTLGHDMLLDVVGAAVIGGVSLFGGRGNVWMVIAGVTFLSLLDKSLQLLGLSLFMVLTVKGCAVLSAAILDGRRVWRARRAV